MVRASLTAFVLATATATLGAPSMADTPLTAVPVATGLQLPVFVTHAPGDDERIFIVEKRGVILVMDLATQTTQTYLDINTSVGGSGTFGDERGMLGLAFHPDYLTNGYFYVNYTDVTDSTQVSRFTVLGDPVTSNVADATTETSILFVSQPQGNHNGGWIGFGPNNGYLYIAMGDGGAACDNGTGHSANGNAQDLTSNLLGKMLRIDVDGASPYAIPATNPFVGITGDDEIWSYGLRNPFRCGFDRATGDLFIGDVGQDLREEVDYQSGSSLGGENWGWRCREGAQCASESPSSCPATATCLCPAGTPSMIDPIHDLKHDDPPAPASFICAVIGGYVYRGSCAPDLQGHYLYADACANAVWSFVQVGGFATDLRDRTTELFDGVVLTSLVSFGEDDAGEMYIVDQGFGANGQIFRIAPAATVELRNAGTNPASYTAGMVEIGGVFNATVDNNVAGQLQSLLFAFDTSISLTLAGGQTLLAFDGGNGELFSGSGLAPTGSAGGVDSYSLTIPNSTALCDLDLFSQSIQFGSPPFELSNANDLSVGY